MVNNDLQKKVTETIEISLTIPEDVSYAGETATVTYTRDTVAGTGIRDLYGNIAANITSPLEASSGSPPTGAVTISGAAREKETLRNDCMGCRKLDQRLYR
jgi:hypothetical protein